MHGGGGPRLRGGYSAVDVIKVLGEDGLGAVDEVWAANQRRPGGRASDSPRRHPAPRGRSGAYHDRRQPHGPPEIPFAERGAASKAFVRSTQPVPLDHTNRSRRPQQV